jgi:probable HAF family extracellular repeat protein
VWLLITAVFCPTLGKQTSLSAQDNQLQHANHHHYQVVDLGTFGGTSSFTGGVNRKGWVTGVASLRRDKAEHAFLWNGHKMDLGTLGGLNSVGNELNERVQVVGVAETSTPDPNGEDFCGFSTNLICLPFLWQRGTMTALPTLGGNNGFASDINNRGEAGGSAENSTQNTACSAGGLETKPVLWQDGRVQELPTISGDPDGVVDAINDHGQAVGGSGICSPLSQHMAHALLWEQGKVTDLGNLGGTDTNEALDINRHGQVVGISTLPGNLGNRAFLWQNGMMTDLGTIAGLTSYSQANGINDKGQVTGFSCDVNFDCVAFLWENGAMTDLNTLVGHGSPSVYIGVRINDRGEISGFGELSNGDSHAVLLIPCDENHPEVEGCDYSLVDASVPSPAESAVGVAGPRSVLPEGGRRVLKAPRGTHGFTGVAAPVSEVNGTVQVKLITPTTHTSCPRSQHALTAIPASLNFGSVPVGQSKELTVLLCNWLPVPVTELGFFVTNNAFEETNNCDGGLPPRGSCVVLVVFAPKSATAYQGSVYVDNLRPREDRTTISLSGHGIQ